MNRQIWALSFRGLCRACLILLGRPWPSFRPMKMLCAVGGLTTRVQRGRNESTSVSLKPELASVSSNCGGQRVARLSQRPTAHVSSIPQGHSVRGCGGSSGRDNVAPEELVFLSEEAEERRQAPCRALLAYAKTAIPMASVIIS